MSQSDEEFRGRYGPWALVAGASEGLGAAFARRLAARGLNLVLLARRAALLRAVAREIGDAHPVEVRNVAVDLASERAVPIVLQATEGLEIGLLVYNAALSVIGSFLAEPLDRHLAELEINCRRPLELSHHFGRAMQQRERGGIVLMSSLAGTQGSPNLAHYGATKAWNTVFAEGLWWELREAGIDVLACRAGATRTPGYLADRSDDGSLFVPEMEPEDVVHEALAALGRAPSMVPGRANRVATFLMQRLLPRRTAIHIMGRAARRVGVG